MLSNAHAQDCRHVSSKCQGETPLKGPAAARAQVFRQAAWVAFATILGSTSGARSLLREDT